MMGRATFNVINFVMVRYGAARLRVAKKGVEVEPRKFNLAPREIFSNMFPMLRNFPFPFLFLSPCLPYPFPFLCLFFVPFHFFSFRCLFPFLRPFFFSSSFPFSFSLSWRHLARWAPLGAMGAAGRRARRLARWAPRGASLWSILGYHQ